MADETRILHPTRNFVFLRPHVEKVTPGGIVMPDRRDDKAVPHLGTVIAVGPGAVSNETGETIRPCVCKPGDTVAYIAYGANLFTWGAETLLLLEDVQVTAIITDA